MTKWYLSGSRIKAVVGHYGSGKTEISLNMALNIRKHYAQTALADMDIVNPFFRSAEQQDLLIANGVEPIHSALALSAADIPALPAEFLSVFARPELRCVLDVGGDDAGAAALGAYKPQLDACHAEVYYVVNPFRPRSSTREQVLEMLAKVQVRARRAITGFILNANLGAQTTPEDLLHGRAFLEEISQECGLPIVAEAGMADVLKEVEEKYPQFPICRYLVPEWMECEKK